MKELGEFSDEFKESQKVLAKKQQDFEMKEKEELSRKGETDAIEKKKMKTISWAVIIAMIVLILILGITLL